AIIDAHLKWRATFNVATDIAPAPPVANPELAVPSYLTISGGSTRSPFRGYVRLGECANLKELGQELVLWHDEGHILSEDAEMATPRRAVRAPKNMFWKWHLVV